MRDIPALSEWLDHRADLVLVVSPHLDDAGLSVAAILKGLATPAHVLTVFTDADGDTNPAWAHQTGFQDAYEEYAARRAEDVAAMEAIGVSYSHAGLAYGPKSDAKAQAMIEAMQAAMQPRTLVLLPLGAGGVSGKFDRLLRKITRRPFGSPVHSDHLWVRDEVRGSLAEAQIGYYAEIPYHWSNSKAELTAKAAPLFAGNFGCYRQRVDAGFKHAIARHYASQLPHELGENPDYQRKAMAADEVVFLPL